MLRRLIWAYRQFRRQRPTAPAKPRWRPAVEMFETRMAPSVTSVFASWEAAITPSAQLTPVHVANLLTEPAPQAVALTPKMTPGHVSGLDSLFTVESESQATYPPFVFVNESGSKVLAQVEAVSAVEVVKFEPAALPTDAPASLPKETVTDAGPPLSRRAAPVLVWTMALSCLLLLREPRRDRPTLSRAVAPERKRGIAERNF